MNTKLLLLSAFTVFYFLATQWWYSNKLAGACCGAITATEAVAGANSEAALPGVASALPIAFNWMKPQPVLGADFEKYQSSTILSGMKGDNVLQITGLYYNEESAPQGFDNMGLARAATVRDLLKAALPKERIDISSRLLADHEKMKNVPFEGVTFNWREALKKEETTIVEVENESTIYFPFNSSVRDKNQEVDAYLTKLAQRLKQTKETVSITGHTDDVGEETANLNLGRSRAESIRAILVTNGIDKDRISIDSKGESQPATSNDTDDSRHRNRRTVLRIVN
jgi:outer membrane protein OmpA-like peptidoglycan-associated protein